MANDTQKITAHLPRKLLEEAQATTGAGITETLRIALEKMTEAERNAYVYRELLKLEGTYKMPISMAEFREEPEKPWMAEWLHGKPADDKTS